MRICPNCGEQNPERARFCLLCGSPLDRPADSGEERKVVTVVFADLVGFTARSDHADPEDVKATLRPYHARLKLELERFGGTLDKFVGDGVMGVFGAPFAHEDDAERAVRSALRIQEAMGEINEAHPGLDLAARIGIATGEVVVTFGAGPQIGESVTGDVVNTASRVQSVAPPGGVVVSGSTYQLTRDAFDYLELGPVSVKGKAEPLSLWQPLAPRSRLGVGVDLRDRPATPFIGRDEDLSILKSAYRRSLRESSVQLVTVTGEPGVGKSRLIREFRTYVDDQPEIVRWRQGRCLPYGEGVTYWALGEIVKALAGILESDGPVEVREKLAASIGSFVDDPGEREWLEARLAPLMGVDEATGAVERDEAFAAWRRLFEAVASEHPLILAFEDLHWADRPLLEFIDHLLEWAGPVPLLVVCAARPELYERLPSWGGGKRNSTTIPLSPLTEREAGLLVSALLDQAVLPPEAQAELVGRAGGNPLFAEEFVRMLRDRGLLAGGSAGMAPATEIPIPSTVQSLVAARLDTLPPERKSLLHDASVIGTVFWSGALAAMGTLEESEIRHHLHEMAMKELVRPARSSSIEGQAEYAFWHLLVRDVAYGQIPRAVRGRKHRAAASWIEAVAGERVGDRAEVLAHHYGQALELAKTSGLTGPAAEQEVRELIEATRRFLVMAGRRALALDVSTARGHFERALALAGVDPAGRAPLLPDLAEALRSGGDLIGAGAYLEEAIELFRGQGRTGQAGDAMVRLSNLLWHRGEAARSHAWLEEGVGLLEQDEPGPEVVNAYTEMARREWLWGRAADAVRWCEKALALATPERMPDAHARALGYRGVARNELGDLRGFDDLRQALQTALGAGLGRETAVLYENLASQLELEKGARAGLDCYRTALEFAESRGLADIVQFTRASILGPLYDLGRWDELLRTADRLLEWSQERAGGYVGVTAASSAAEVLAERGELARAARLAAEFLPAARDIGEPHIVAPALDISALVRLRSGDPDGARELMREYGSSMASQSGWDRAQRLPPVLRLCLELGEAGLAESIAGGIEAAGFRQELCLRSARALLQELRGEPEAAHPLFREAAEGWEQYGSVVERAHALLGHGRCLVALRGDPSPSLDEAGGVFAALGSTGALREIEGLRARAVAVG